MKKVFLLIFIIHCVYNCKAREYYNTFNLSDTTVHKRQITHTAFLELFGNGLNGSVNYAVAIPIRKKTTFSYRIGGFYLNLHDGYVPRSSLINEFSIAYGLHHRISSGVGATYSYGFWSDNYPIRYVSENIFLTIKPLEYKYQPRCGFYCAASILYFVKVYEKNAYVRNHPREVGKFPIIGPSLSFGYTFNSEK